MISYALSTKYIIVGLGIRTRDVLSLMEKCLGGPVHCLYILGTGLLYWPLSPLISWLFLNLICIAVKRGPHSNDLSVCMRTECVSSCGNEYLEWMFDCHVPNFLLPSLSSPLQFLRHCLIYLNAMLLIRYYFFIFSH